ncbi:hypothetical protein PspLS_11517 [Pyricularia sp. CBS 133598]|nr:hypothetical protein PspLS_11517 [Pyricularia sp. CBS 133598]
MQLPSIVAAALLAQSIFADPMQAEDPDAPRTSAGSRVALDLYDPDRINYETPFETCMNLCFRGYPRWHWRRRKYCKAFCRDNKKQPKTAKR